MPTSPREGVSRWKFECPESCGYHIDVASDRGAGEAVGKMMDEHMRRSHNARFPVWEGRFDLERA